MKRMRWILKFACGMCQHSQMSRVFTINKRTYRVCYECGREFNYSWDGMHVVPTNVSGATDLSGSAAERSETIAVDALAV